MVVGEGIDDVVLDDVVLAAVDQSDVRSGGVEVVLVLPSLGMRWGGGCLRKQRQRLYLTYRLIDGQESTV